MLQELADIHLTVIDHTVCPPDLGTFILVEEVLAKDKLYLLELLNPHLLREITERPVICGAGERGVHLAYVTVAERLVEDCHGVKRHRHKHVGLEGKEPEPYIPVTYYPQP